jgi:hypothetical protein
MALARCEKHRPAGNRKNYVVAVGPVGYPNTATICGRPGCEEPALVWLTEAERAEHERGVAIFRFDSNVAKVRVMPQNRSS